MANAVALSCINLLYFNHTARFVITDHSFVPVQCVTVGRYYSSTEKILTRNAYF